MRDYSAFFDHLGYRKHFNRDKNVVLTLPIKPELLSSNGTIPPGLFSSMLDIVIGTTIGEEVQKATTTVNLTMDFFDLTNRGPYTAEASVTHQDGKMIIGEGIVLNAEEKVVAKGVGTFKALSTKYE